MATRRNRRVYRSDIPVSYKQMDSGEQCDLSELPGRVRHSGDVLLSELLALEPDRPGGMSGLRVYTRRLPRALL